MEIQPTITQVTSGTYTFNITDKTNIGRDVNTINNRFFRIGGTENCIELLVYYVNNIPTTAYLPTVEYSSECSIGTKLDKGGGTRNMLNVLLSHIHKLFPEIKTVGFDDMSKIDCATEEEKRNSRNLRPRSLVKPIDLCMFSIAFNGMTWYEKYFGAKMKNQDKYELYRNTVEQLLTSSEHKPSKDDLRNPTELNSEIDKYYDGTKTFGEFLQNIPNSERYRHAREWLIQFMTIYLNNVFQHNDWVIDMSIPFRGGGKTRKYYCPKGFRRTYCSRRSCIV